MAKTPNTAERKVLAAKGLAKPDGSYPIQDASDVESAVTLYNLQKGTPSDKAWIIKRAKALNATDKLPSTWGVAPIKHEAVDLETFLSHVMPKSLGSHTKHSQAFLSKATNTGKSKAKEVLSSSGGKVATKSADGKKAAELIVNKHKAQTIPALSPS